MEKRTPHYRLATIKSLVNEGHIRSTQSARQGAVLLGADFKAMCEVLQSLTSTDFYKSMTAYSDHKIWQDVYRPNTVHGDIYLKLTVIADVVIISFKEL